MYGASHMREFTLVPLGESQSVPGGRQLVGQAANLTFESACRLVKYILLIYDANFVAVYSAITYSEVIHPVMAEGHQ